MIQAHFLVGCAMEVATNLSHDGGRVVRYRTFVDRFCAVTFWSLEPQDCVINNFIYSRRNFM
jgi:hypothetical protein